MIQEFSYCRITGNGKFADQKPLFDHDLIIYRNDSETGTNLKVCLQGKLFSEPVQFPEKQCNSNGDCGSY